ncbi:MAG: methyltransferase domain-containing protein [Burkholderiales bacterium]|nr:methyltransferase domain-containing protein [Burkholderiales bacterium]
MQPRQSAHATPPRSWYRPDGSGRASCCQSGKFSNRLILKNNFIFFDAACDNRGHRAAIVGTASGSAPGTDLRPTARATLSSTTSLPSGSAGPPAPSPRSLAEWFDTPPGRYVLAWEQDCLDQTVADVFGYFALQVGLPGIDFLRANRIPWRTTCGLDAGSGIVADAHEMPFAAESLDLVLLPHLLETTSEPHQILREVERALRPEGQLVVTGFNPVSLWGLRRALRPAGAPPWDHEFVSVARMKDWLKLLNFEMRGGRFGCYRPPFDSEKWLARFGLLERVGARSWPMTGAVYMVQARKRVAGMRLITPARARARARAGLLAPTVRAAAPCRHSQGDA